MSELEEIVKRINDLENRLSRVHAFEFNCLDGIHGSSYIVNNLASLTDTSTHTTGDIRGSYGVPLYAAGIWCVLYAQSNATNSSLYIDSADDTPDTYSSRLAITVTSVHHSALCMVRLGLTTGANSGKVTLKAAGATFSNIYMWPVGYWG